MHDVVRGPFLKEITASSHKPEHPPQNIAVDDGRWSAYQQVVGAWIQIDFDHKHVVTSVGLTHPKGSTKALGDRTAVVAMQWSDGTWEDNFALTQVDEEQVFPVTPKAATSVKLQVVQSFGSKGAGFESVRVMGWDCECENLRVSPHDKISPALLALVPGGCLWLSEGDYKEALTVTKPLTMIGLFPAVPTIISPSPLAPAISVEAFDVHIHGISVLQLANDPGIPAPLDFRHDR